MSSNWNEVDKNILAIIYLKYAFLPRGDTKPFTLVLQQAQLVVEAELLYRMWALLI